MNAQNVIKSLILEHKIKTFLVHIEQEQEQDQVNYVFHSDTPIKQSILAAAEVYLAKSNINAKCKNKVHSSSQLGKLSSLEAFADQFIGFEVVYDSTKIIARSTALVKLSRQLRHSAAANISSICFESRKRTVYILLDDTSKDLMNVEDLLAFKQRVEIEGHQWMTQEESAFELEVRIGYEIPPLARVVPIDRLSAVQSIAERIKAKFVRAFGVAGLAGALGITLATPSHAEGDQAVGQPNFDTSLGPTASSAGGGAGINLKGAINLFDNIGVQVQGNANSNNANGVGGMLFYRDPNSFALGVSASRSSYKDIDLNQYAARVEMYLNNVVTFSAGAGAQTGDAGKGAMGNLGVKFYVSPNMLAKISAEHTPNFNSVKTKIEYRPALEALPGLSVFADAEFGEHDQRQAMLGLTYYFGEKTRTLFERDRYDQVDFNTDHTLAMRYAYEKSREKSYTEIPG